MERFRAHAERLLEALRANRANHELLERDRGVRVRTTVDDVHHRHRQHERIAATNVAIERHTKLIRRRLRDRE